MALTSQNKITRSQSGQDWCQGASVLVVSETQNTQTGPKTVHIRLPKELKDKITEDAKYKYTSVNALIMSVLVKEYGGAE